MHSHAIHNDSTGERALKFKGYTLNPFQVQAARALESNKNVLVSAPTGAGKTLVAEYAIEQAIEAGRKVIYTSPIKALSNQKYRDFKADGIEVGLMTGDLTLEPHAALVIMTTEIFRNSVFEDPRALQRLRLRDLRRDPLPRRQGPRHRLGREPDLRARPRPLRRPVGDHRQPPAVREVDAADPPPRPGDHPAHEAARPARPRAPAPELGVVQGRTAQARDGPHEAGPPTRAAEAAPRGDAARSAGPTASASGATRASHRRPPRWSSTTSRTSGCCPCSTSASHARSARSRRASTSTGSCSRGVSAGTSASCSKTSARSSSSTPTSIQSSARSATARSAASATTTPGCCPSTRRSSSGCSPRGCCRCSSRPRRSRSASTCPREPWSSTR